MDRVRLESIGESARDVFDSRFSAREHAITDSRKVIRSSANAIRSLHRSEFAEADELIASAGAMLAEMLSVVSDHPVLIQAGFVADAAKEYAEASLTRAIFGGAEIPSFEDLGIDPAA